MFIMTESYPLLTVYLSLFLHESKICSEKAFNFLCILLRTGLIQYSLDIL